MNEFDDSDHEPLTANEIRSGGYSNDESYLNNFDNEESDSDNSMKPINKSNNYPVNKVNDNVNNINNPVNNKIKAVQKEIDIAKDAVRKSLVKAVDRGDRLESISISANNLQVQAGLFKKNAKRTRVHFCVQKWKMIAIFICIIGILGLSLGLWSLNMGDDEVQNVDNTIDNTIDNPIQNKYDSTDV
eukprot:80791_1